MTQFNGSKLRELRNEKQMSIAKLSTISDVSTGLISQIERDLVVPSALILFRLAQALETDMYAFFEDTPPEDTPIIRKGNHNLLTAQENSCIHKILCPDNPGRMLDFVELTLKKGCSYDYRPSFAQGETCGYVTQGTLQVIVEGRVYTLQEGDSITLDSTLPHHCKNNSDTDSVSIWVITPKYF